MAATSLAGWLLVIALLTPTIGLAIAIIGIDLQSGVARSRILDSDGLGFLVVAIGLFAL